MPAGLTTAVAAVTQGRPAATASEHSSLKSEEKPPSMAGTPRTRLKVRASEKQGIMSEPKSAASTSAVEVKLVRP